MYWTQCEGGELCCGGDIGRKKDLTVLWVLERLGDVLYTRHIECLQNMSKADQEAVMWSWMAGCSRTCMDATGIGIGWADAAQGKIRQYAVGAVNFMPHVKAAQPNRGRLHWEKDRGGSPPKQRITP